MKTGRNTSSIRHIRQCDRGLRYLQCTVIRTRVEYIVYAHVIDTVFCNQDKKHSNIYRLCANYGRPKCLWVLYSGTLYSYFNKILDRVFYKICRECCSVLPRLDCLTYCLQDLYIRTCMSNKCKIIKGFRKFHHTSVNQAEYWLQTVHKCSQYTVKTHTYLKYIYKYVQRVKTTFFAWPASKNRSAFF